MGHADAHQREHCACQRSQSRNVAACLVRPRANRKPDPAVPGPGQARARNGVNGTWWKKPALIAGAIALVELGARLGLPGVTAVALMQYATTTHTSFLVLAYAAIAG